MADVEVKNAHNGKPWPMKPWPRERLDILAVLWAEGLSARECGRRLGVTKNAVIGITHRHREMFVRRKEPKKENRVFRKRPKARKVKPKLAVTASDVSKVLPLFSKPELPREPGLDLLELRESTCKFPLPGPLKPPYRYCGEATSEAPYCEKHRKLCYQPWRRHG